MQNFESALSYYNLLSVIVISRFLKRYSKAKRTRAPAYSRALIQTAFSSYSVLMAN